MRGCKWKQIEKRNKLRIDKKSRHEHSTFKQTDEKNKQAKYIETERIQHRNHKFKENRNRDQNKKKKKKTKRKKTKSRRRKRRRRRIRKEGGEACV